MASAQKKRRGAGVFAVLFAGALTAACVDLFHSTDFDTLCTTDPTNPQCAVDGGRETTTVLETGVDAAHPHPDFCSWSHSVALLQAKNACARLGGCVGPLKGGGTVFGPCVLAAQLAFDCSANKLLRPAGETDQFWSCVATATSCGEIRDCVYPKGIETCVPETIGPGSFNACGPREGNPSVEITCPTDVDSGPPSAAVPCAMFGQTCSVDGGPAACTGTQGYSCSASGCRNTFASFCLGTRDQGVDCAAVSASCVEVGVGDPACKPTATDATTCSGVATPACDGDNKVSACIGGKLVTVDCAQLGESGLPCDVSTSPPLYAIANACIDNTTPATCGTADEKCTSAVLSSCAGGRKVSVDCVAAGFTGCDDASTPPRCTGDKPTF